MSVLPPNPPRWMSPPPTYDAPSTHMSSSSLRPYLQLPHLLSLTWLAYPILSLLFVAFRLQLSLSSSQDAVASAKGDLLSSCKAAEQAATAAASMPRYMAIATNQQFVEAVNGSMNAARAALVLALTVMEAIINFIIDTYRSTFLCFLELVVRGGLSILISAVQELNTFVQNTTGSIRTSIQNDVATANSAIQTAINAVNKVNPFGDISVPQFSIPSLSALENVTLPTDFENALISLNSSLPSIAQLKQEVESFIDTPFELLKKDINDTFANITFDVDLLPVPQQNLLTFCNDLDTSIIDDLGQDLIKVAKIGTIILILLALLLIGANCLLEWYKWRCLTRHLEYTRQAWTSDPTLYHSGSASAPRITLSDHNLLMLQANGAHPLLTRITNTLSTRLRLSPTQHTHLQWFFHYVFHPPALACFLIGFFGLLSVQIQLFALGPLAAKFSDAAASSVADFSNTIATSINDTMFNQSAAYANDINTRVDAVQLTINNGVFGWVNGTTTTLNTTIVNFYNDVQNAVSAVFNGTILEQPAQDFVKCIIGSKVDAIENALTFLNENLKVDIPRVNESVLVLSPASVNEATRPIATAAIGGGSDDDGGLIGKLVKSYAAGLRKERIMFAIFMGIWGFVVFMALCIILWHSYGRGLLEKRRRRKWEREQRVGIDGIVIPYRLNHPGDGKGGNRSQLAPQDDLPAFTPMPSPRPINLFNRSASPASRPNDSLDTLAPPVKDTEKSWDSFFGQKGGAQPVQTRAISKPMKLMAIGKKAMGRERFVGDDEELARGSEQHSEQQQPTLFARFAGLLGRKSQPESPTADQGSFREKGRPNLMISIERASTVSDGLPQVENIRDSHDQGGLRSAWSVTPTKTPPSMPWTNMLSPTKPQAHPIPIRPKPRHNVSVPSDVTANALDISPASSLKPTPLAVPLFHGFESPKKPTFRPPPPPSMKISGPHSILKSPHYRHRRTSSVPSEAWNIDTNTTGDNISQSSTPVTRLLTTLHARHSSSLNPFITPFDDEHRVTINNTRPPNVRKSIPTNPFAAIAL